MDSRKAKQKVGREIIHIIVGGMDGEDFGVHKDLICGYSSYFKGAFTSGFEEAKTGVIKLSSDTEIETFQLFHDWLYSQALWNCFENDDDLPMEDLVKLYVFADMAGVPKLKNDCIETFARITRLQNKVSINLLPFIWENTVEDDPLRRYIIDWIVYNVDPDTFIEHCKTLPGQIHIDVLAAIGKVLRKYRGAFRIPRSQKAKEPENPLHDLGNYYEEEPEST